MCFAFICIMTVSFTEQRQYSRRPLKQAVIFYENEDWDLNKHSLGQTHDVSTRGMCIQTRTDHMPEPGSILRFTLLLPTDPSLSSIDSAVHINARVAWINHKIRRFGVSFT